MRIGALVLLIAGLALMLSNRVTVERKDVGWQSPAGDLVQASLHVPAGKGPYPTVFCCYSIYQNRELAEQLSESLAANGVAAVTLVQQAHSPALKRDKLFEEYAGEIKAGVKALQGSPYVDPARTYVFGHSMGADLACNVASSDKSIRACCAAGFPVDAFPDAPQNLLLAVGVWDQLHPLSEMRKALVQATGDPNARELHTYGKFADGTARRLTLLPLANHALEVQDPMLLRELLAFVGQAPARFNDAVVQRMLGQGLLLIGAFGTLLPLLLALRGKLRRGPGLLLLLLAPALWLLHQPKALLLLALAVAVANALPDLRALRRPLLLLAAIWFTLTVTNILIAYEARLAHPNYLLWLIPASLYAVPMEVSESVTQASSSLPLLATLILFELLWPGALVRALAATVQKIIRSIQKLDLRIEGKVSPAQLGVLAVLLIAGGVAWRQTLGGGYQLDSSELTRLLFLLARLILFPALMMALIVRTRPFRQDPAK